MSRALNLDQADRVGCRVTYNMNAYEVYHAAGWLLTKAYSTADLKEQLKTNQITDAKFSPLASHKYLTAR